MAKTGERYNAARRSLIEQAGARNDDWVSTPEASDDAVREATGKGWNDWRSILDEWGGRNHTHTELAAHLASDHGLPGWWSQQVAGGYERITGMRLPGQMPDGTFTANVSRTLVGSAAELRAMLDDDSARADLFGGEPAQARSKSGVKAPRFAMAEGVAQISIEAKPPASADAAERMTVRIQHNKLDTSDDIERWKFFWSDWLDALDAAARTDG